MNGLFCALIVAAFSKAQVVCDTKECVESATKRTSYKKGDLMKLVAKIDTFNTEEEKVDTYYARWFLETDKLAVVEIPNKNCVLTSSNETNITFSTNFGSTETINYRHEENEDYVMEFFSLLALFKNGKGTGLTFDTTFDNNACKIRNPLFKYGCAAKQTFDSEQCNKKEKTIKVFVGFVGQDADEIPFVSAQEMPSSFIKFGAGGIVDDATQLVNTAYQWVSSTIKDIEDLV